MPIAIKELASPDATNRRNGAYCVGELCRNGGEKALQYYNSILVALHPLFGTGETDNGVRDNAAGAVARMINAQPNALPLNQVDYLQSCSKTADPKTDQLIAFPSLSSSFQSLTSSEGGGVSLDLEILFVCPFLDGNQMSSLFLTNSVYGLGFSFLMSSGP
jgi:hypothetical protein